MFPMFNFFKRIHPTIRKIGNDLTGWHIATRSECDRICKEKGVNLLLSDHLVYIPVRHEIKDSNNVIFFATNQYIYSNDVCINDMYMSNTITYLTTSEKYFLAKKIGAILQKTAGSRKRISDFRNEYKLK